MHSLLGVSDTAVLTGAIELAPIEIRATNARGSDDETFVHVRTSTHAGWVHDGGFAFTISSRTLDEHGTHVHDLDILIDQEEDLDLRAEPNLWRFLERCTHDATIGSTGQPIQLPAKRIPQLRNAQFFAEHLRVASTIPGWDQVDAPLRRARDAENLHTLAWVATMARNPAAVHTFGFQVLQKSESEPTFDETPMRCDVPVVANFGDQSIVCWTDADIAMFTIGDNGRGFRFDKVHSAWVEPGQRRTKSTSHPELVFHASWPTLSIEDGGKGLTKTDATLWGLGLAKLRPR